MYLLVLWLRAHPYRSAGLLVLCATGALTACLILLFDLFLPHWAAALLAGVLLAAVAALLAMEGKKRLSKVGTPVPEQTIETVKEDVEWAKTRASSARR